MSQEQPESPSPTQTVQTSLESYFQCLIPKSQSLLEVTQKHNNQRIQNINKMLDNGSLAITVEQIDLEQLLNKANPEKEQLDENQKRKKFINRQLEYLRSQTEKVKVGDGEQVQNEERFVLDKNQHKKVVSKIVQERKKHEKKHTQMLRMMQEKRQNEQKKRQEEQRSRKISQNEKKKINIQKHREKMKQQHQEFLKKEKDSQLKYQEIKSKKPYYEQLEDRYRAQNVYKGLEQKKQKLKQIRQFKTLEMSSLKEHQKHYLEQRQMSISRKKKEETEWNYVPPKRSERIEKIFEEERMQKIRKNQEKKKNMDQKISRKQFFASYLRQNFAPVVDPKKKLELQSKIKNQRTQRQNQTFDSYEIGINYLEESKRKAKRSSSRLRPESQRNSPISSKTIDQQRKRQTSTYTNYLQHKDNEEHFQTKRRKNLQRIVKTSKIPQNQKVKLLQLQSNKINQVIQMKQKQLKYKNDSKLKQDSLELLLSSIQAKIGIIQSFK